MGLDMNTEENGLGIISNSIQQIIIEGLPYKALRVSGKYTSLWEKINTLILECTLKNCDMQGFK